MQKDIYIVKKLMAAVQYIIAIAVLFPLSLCSVYGMRPFATSYMFSLIFSGAAFAVIAPFYILSELLADFSAINILTSVLSLALALGCRITLLKWKHGKVYGKVILAAFVSGAQMLTLFKVFYSDLPPIVFIVWCAIGIGFTFLCLWAVVPLFVNKLKYKLLQTECIACCVLLCCMGVGLQNIALSFSFYLAFTVFAFLTGGAVGGMSSALVAAISLGTGGAITSGAVGELCALIFAAAVSMMFASAPKALGALSAPMAYIVFMFLFGQDVTIMNTVSVLVGSVLFLMIPRFSTDKLKNYLYSSHALAAAKSLVSRSKRSMGLSLLQSQRIFLEMSEGLMRKNEDVPDCGKDIQEGVCQDCENYFNCRLKDGFEQALVKLAQSSCEKGRASIAEMPLFLSKNCKHLNKLFSFAGEMAQRIYLQLQRHKNESAAREIVSDQLCGMASVLKKLGDDAMVPVQFDSSAEQSLLEELGYNGIVASEVMVSGGNVSLVIRTETMQEELCLKCVKRVLKSAYCVLSAEQDSVAGFTVLNLAKAPKYDVVFATGAVPKRSGDKSGDSHSFIKIGNDKFLMALCDGMGSGSDAQRISETAIGLIESFYKAGFGHDLVLSSVNRFLTIGGGEKFSTLDIAVIDLNSGATDIIKFGAPSTIIKTADSVRAVEGSSLPMGVVTKAKPSISSVTLGGGEMVVMTTDGVSEQLPDHEILSAVNNMRTKNPSQLAEGLLRCALNVTKGIPRDDSTVLCARIFERV